MENELLTVEELCRWLKISRSTADRWRKEGMPFSKKKRLVRFDKEEVLEWLKEKNKD